MLRFQTNRLEKVTYGCTQQSAAYNTFSHQRYKPLSIIFCSWALKAPLSLTCFSLHPFKLCIQIAWADIQCTIYKYINIGMKWDLVTLVYTKIYTFHFIVKVSTYQLFSDYYYKKNYIYLDSRWMIATFAQLFIHSTTFFEPSLHYYYVCLQVVWLWKRRVVRYSHSTTHAKRNLLHVTPYQVYQRCSTP